MNIAHVAPLWYPVSAKTTGGAELLAGQMSAELHRRGHRVTLFASGESVIPGVRLRPLIPTAIHLSHPAIRDYDTVLRAVYRSIVRDLRGFDIVHFHDAGLESRHIMRFVPHHLQRKSVITVHHTASFSMIKKFSSMKHDFSVVYISRYTERLFGRMPHSTVIHNGVHPTAHAGRGGPGYIFVGRITPDKGVDIAARLAAKQGWNLTIVGGMTRDTEQYFSTRVKPFIDASHGRIRYLGVQSHAQVMRRIAISRALLLPIRWAEPFGLVAVEAGMCGTPVIAMRRGALPEIITNGVNGYLANSVDEFSKKAARAGRLSRSACRREAIKRYSFSTMIRRYEELYESLVGLSSEG